MTEPRPLFDDNTPQTHTGRGSDSRPVAVSDAGPAQSAKQPQPTSGYEPSALAFDDVIDKSSASTSLTSVNFQEPAPLTWEVSKVSEDTRKQMDSFSNEYHPSQSPCERNARAIDAAFFDKEEIRIRRCISQLLPVSVDRVQDYGDRALERGKTLAQQTTELTLAFAKLGASDLLAEAVKAHAPKKSFLGQLKSRLSPVAVDYRPRIVALEETLKKYRKDVKELLPEVAAQGLRLAVHLIALRAVEQNCGKDPQNLALQLLNRRLGLFGSSVSQAAIAEKQLEQLMTAIATLEAECEQTLNVTLSAINLASAMGQTH